MIPLLANAVMSRLFTPKNPTQPNFTNSSFQLSPDGQLSIAQPGDSFTRSAVSALKTTAKYTLVTGLVLGGAYLGGTALISALAASPIGAAAAALYAVMANGAGALLGLSPTAVVATAASAASKVAAAANLGTLASVASGVLATPALAAQAAVKGVALKAATSVSATAAGAVTALKGMLAAPFQSILPMVSGAPLVANATEAVVTNGLNLAPTAIEVGKAVTIGGLTNAAPAIAQTAIEVGKGAALNGLATAVSGVPIAEVATQGGLGLLKDTAIWGVSKLAGLVPEVLRYAPVY